jgi:hypothetical protein
MNTDNLISHNFFQQLIKDAEPFLKETKFSDKYIVDKNEIEMSDLEHYIHYVSFYNIHLFQLCNQLERAVNLLSNFRTDDKNEIGWGHHLSYNIENFFIRLDSLYDRVLQLVNAIYNFGLTDNLVNKKSVTKKINAVDGYIELNNSLEMLNKVLKNYSDEKRNIIVHRYSYFDQELDRIEMYYHPFYSKKILEDKDIAENFKEVRKEELTFYLSKTKKEFTQINQICFEKLLLIFDALDKQYSIMKLKLK